MNIDFNKTGADRKALVAAVSEATGAPSKYMGAPGFAYTVGGYTVTKDGLLECGDAQVQEVSALLESLAESGFLPTQTPDLSGVAEAETVTSLAGDDVLSIELPAEGLSDTATENLRRLAAGKAPLIRAALGDNIAGDAAELAVVFEDGRVRFPWFRPGMDADAVDAWTRFIAALCATAKKQKRVIMTEKPYDGSEKYAMRCFLLKLGFIGEEYKPARKILLANLSGNGSHKNTEDSYAPVVEQSPRAV